MKKRIFFCILLLLYVALLFPFSAYMKSKPFVEKLGYLPRPEVIVFAAADQKYALADLLVKKALFYFGGLVETTSAEFILPADYEGIYRTLAAAVKLDPYNQDAYYFVQAAMSWHTERVKQANLLLEYGMHYRNWDYQLPFFLGFNYAYFLKDYANAAKYYQKAAELTGDPLLANLAGRYFYESRRTDLALSYMTAMELSATNPAIKKSFQVRIAAFRQVKEIETALKDYLRDFHGEKPTIDILLDKGYLKEPPVDPYGGEFFIDPTGQVRSTSKFAYAGVGSGKGSGER